MNINNVGILGSRFTLRTCDISLESDSFVCSSWTTFEGRVYLSQKKSHSHDKNYSAYTLRIIFVGVKLVTDFEGCNSPTRLSGGGEGFL